MVFSRFRRQQLKNLTSCSREWLSRKFRAKVPEVPVTILTTGRRHVHASIVARSGRRSIRKNGKGNVGQWAFPCNDGTPFNALGLPRNVGTAYNLMSLLFFLKYFFPFFFVNSYFSKLITFISTQHTYISFWNVIK